MTEKKQYVFELKEFRKNHLKLTQSELAKLMNVEQSRLSRWESKPKSLPTMEFIKVCDIAGMTPSQVMVGFKLDNPTPIDFGNQFVERNRKIRLFEDVCQPMIRKHEKENGNSVVHSAITDIENAIQFVRSKPILTFIGKFDSGKSRMINALTGVEGMVSRWTPTTAITAYIKHIDDKPKFIKEDVWIFKDLRDDETNENIGWDFRKLYDKEHCSKFLVARGGFELLAKYGTHSDRTKDLKIARSAVVFLDSKLLKSCDIIDMPGFGSADGKSDDMQVQETKKIADAVVYLSKSNDFMDAEDVMHVKDILKYQYGVNISDENGNAFDRILIVASQAHIPHSNELDRIVEKGSKILFKQLPKSLLESYKKEPTNADLKSRFTYYSLDNKNLRKDFDAKFEAMIIDSLIPQYKNTGDKLLSIALESSHGKIDKEVNKYNTLLNNIDKYKEEHARITENRPEEEEKLSNKLNELKAEIDDRIPVSINKFNEWWRYHISVDEIYSEIENRGYNRKDAKQYIGGNIIDNIQDEKALIVKEDFEPIREKIDLFFKEYEDYIKDISISSEDMEFESVPFDFQGVISGALATAGVFGGLGIWASALENLGWYIIAAKGVSLLSAFGISVGGTAGAMAFLATIGGPITLAIGVAVTIGLGIKALFGDNWKKRLAKALIKELDNKNVQAETNEQIESFWDDTKTGLDHIVKHLQKETDNYLASVKNLIENEDPKIVKKELKNCKYYLDKINILKSIHSE